jgi:NAD(P)-dependent dehydrogenase (short-subunit alcohol dehydrogenase family)
MRIALVTNAEAFGGPAALRGLRDAGFTVATGEAANAVASPEALVATTVERFGRLDVVVSNDVHPARARPVGEASADELREALEALVVTPFRLLTAAARVFQAQGGGRAIVISSCRDRLPLPGGALADAARAATNAMVRSFAIDLARHGIAVNAIAPNFFASEAYFPKARYVDDPDGRTFVAEQVPVGRLGEEPELAALVAYLATTPGIFHTGSVIEFAGGWPQGRPRPFA